MNKTLIKFLLFYSALIGGVAFFFPFVFSAILATVVIVVLLEPFSIFLSRTLKLPRRISNAVALIVFFFSFALLLIFLIPSLMKEAANFYEMVAKFFEKREWEKILPPDVGIRITQLVSTFQPKLLKLLADIISAVTKFAPHLFTFMFYVILGSIYLIYHFQFIRRRIPRIFPKSCRREATFFLRDTYIQLRQYIFSIVIVAVTVGISMGILLTYLGSKYTILLSFWAIFTNFIPIVGVFLEMVPLFLMTFSLGLKASIILAIGVIIIHTIAFLLFLKLMEGYIRINPVAIIFLIMFFSSTLGVLGALIAVPTAVVFKIFWIRFLTPALDAK
ncbi:MAG: AI-2E family transporter [Synergistetes bacterium]|nr:AI-2E family transporter [Synergistota bacterium]